MIYYFLHPLVHSSHIANIFHYITFRSFIALFTSFFVGLVIAPLIIEKLRVWQKFGQSIRELGQVSHQAKAATPTMGGIIILISMMISIFLFADLTNVYVIVTVLVTLGFGMLGFADDYLKIIKKNHKGLSPRHKLIVQTVVGLIGCIMMYRESSDTVLILPFFKNIAIDLGYFYLIFAAFVMVGSSNAVNLTDGLDGLATVPVAMVASCFGVISYIVGNIIHAQYLQLHYIAGAGELCIVCAALIGSLMSFLWYNAQPAEVIMGDTGSLALGGAIGAISVATKHEILLAISGGVFVIETLSVMIQIYYFRSTGGKRFFKMAPLHHHFEKVGWSESKIVVRFWILSIVFTLIALSSLKLR